MIPPEYDDEDQVKKCFTKDDLKKETLFGSYFKSVTKVTDFHRGVRKISSCSRIENFEKVNITLENEGEWVLQHTDIKLSRVSVVTTQPPLHVGKATISYGEYEEIDCYVKQDHHGEMFGDIQIYRFSEKNYWKLKKIVKDIIRAMIHLHDKGIVHGRIRPQHIFVKEYESISQVAKLGGMGGWAKVTELDKEPFTRDIYDMGRTILAILDNQHKIPDDDVEAQEHYKSPEPFEDNVQHLYRSDPLVGHLIKQCLTCEVLAKEIFNQFCFYEDGTYLEFMKDTVKVNQQLWDAIKTSLLVVVGKEHLKTPCLRRYGVLVVVMVITNTMRHV
ncbi:serine/threonine-protein kinase/endoribonuclease IRE1a isoform X1 [Tanacetum coccineum]